MPSYTVVVHPQPKPQMTLRYERHPEWVATVTVKELVTLKIPGQTSMASPWLGGVEEVLGPLREEQM